MSRDDPQFKLRLPPELRDRIEQAAKESKRSINAEIVSRLELSFSHGEDFAKYASKLDEASIEIIRRTTVIFKELLEQADKDASKK